MFWITKEISEKTGLTSRHISRLIRQGVIKGEKKGHDWWVDDEEAKRFIEEHNKTE